MLEIGGGPFFETVRFAPPRDGASNKYSAEDPLFQLFAFFGYARQMCYLCFMALLKDGELPKLPSQYNQQPQLPSVGKTIS